MQESISRLKLDWNQGPFAEPSHPPPSVFLCCFHIQVLEVQKVERQNKRLPEEPIKTHFMSGYVNHRGNHWDGLRTALCAPWLCSEKKSMWWRGCSGSLVFLDQESGWRKKTCSWSLWSMLSVGIFCSTISLKYLLPKPRFCSLFELHLFIIINLPGCVWGKVHDYYIPVCTYSNLNKDIFEWLVEKRGLWWRLFILFERSSDPEAGRVFKDCTQVKVKVIIIQTITSVKK